MLKVSRMTREKKRTNERTKQCKDIAHINNVCRKESAQVYVNAHLYCTKIRWNELLMKLKYISDEKLSSFEWNQGKASIFAKQKRKRERETLVRQTDKCGRDQNSRRKKNAQNKKTIEREWLSNMKTVGNWWRSEIDRKLLWRSQSNNNQL